MFGSLLAHVTWRPLNALPLASFGVAVNWNVLCTVIVADAGVTSTLATGACVTETMVVPLLPSLVAVIVADPIATPRTRPVPSTLAMVGALLCQVTVRPDNWLPFASVSVAVNCTVLPAWIPGFVGETATFATGTGRTVMAEVPFFPSLVAVIVIGPPVTCAVTSPFASTDAVFGSALAHVTVLPVSGLPFASLGVPV